MRGSLVARPSQAAHVAKIAAPAMTERGNAKDLTSPTTRASLPEVEGHCGQDTGP